MAAAKFPTPRAADGMGHPLRTIEAVCSEIANNGRAQPGRLEDFVVWATPAARDWRSGLASEETMARNSRPLSEQVGGSLNPTWVEWLMGYPLGWTALEPSETP
jgi:hypothetical protein